MSPAYPTWEVRDADPRYIDYLLRSPRLLSEYRRLAAGAVMRRRSISKDSFLSIQIRMPAREAQERIAIALRSIEEALEAARLKQQALQLLRSTLHSRLLAKGLGEQVPLKTLLAEPLRNGHSAPATKGGGIRTLTLSAVTNDEFDELNTKLTAANPDRVKDLWLRKDDILIERANTRELVGTAARYKGSDSWAIFPDLMIRVRPDHDKILPSVLTEFLTTRDVREYFQSRARGSASRMPKIDQRIVEDLLVTVPTREPQTVPAAMKELFAICLMSPGSSCFGEMKNSDARLRTFSRPVSLRSIRTRSRLVLYPA